nr:energy transducer TonB [Odoribacter sp. OF09-27XD]
MFNQLSYPQAAIDSTIQGTVVLKFTIMPSGIVDSLRITQPVHPLLDAEALRLFKEMPQWKPVIYQGNPIAVTYEIPVIFELVDPEKK